MTLSTIRRCSPTRPTTGCWGRRYNRTAWSSRDPQVMLASLDHAIWFHRPFRVDEWLLHVVESSASAGARAFSRGTFYTRDGTLVASTAQEGLLRVREAGR